MSCVRTLNHPLVQQEGRKEKIKAGSSVCWRLMCGNIDSSDMKRSIYRIQVKEKFVLRWIFFVKMSFCLSGLVCVAGVKVGTVGAEIKRLKCYIKMPLEKKFEFPL